MKIGAKTTPQGNSFHGLSAAVRLTANSYCSKQKYDSLNFLTSLKTELELGKLAQIKTNRTEVFV